MPSVPVAHTEIGHAGDPSAVAAARTKVSGESLVIFDGDRAVVSGIVGPFTASPPRPRGSFARWEAA